MSPALLASQLVGWEDTTLIDGSVLKTSMRAVLHIERIGRRRLAFEDRDFT